MIQSEHRGVVPKSLKEITAFPGVGLKMAHLLLQIEFGIVVGISVDTHVHRISNRLKWVKKATKNPDQTSEALQEWLPKDNWRDINKLLVSFG
jgi:endonuclease-3